MDFGLDGKVAIVTGAAAGGIGQAYARTLATAGASVLIADINTEGARATADQLTTEGLNVSSTAVDITDPESAKNMASTAKERFGGIDILVNNAALMAEFPRGPMIEFPLDWWHRLFEVNLTGYLICAQVCVPSMIERGRGKIINQSSAGAWTLTSPYSISKLAVNGLTVALAKELGKNKINVNAIAPGMIQTDATRSMGHAFDTQLETERLATVTPLQAFAPPDDLCGALLYLASPASDFMTGQVLNVDGGWIMRM